MRASTVGCRVLDRCGDSLGVETSLKDIRILAAVLNSRCRCEVSLGRIYEQVLAFARRLYGSKEHLVIDSRIYRELAQ